MTTTTTQQQHHILLVGCTGNVGQHIAKVALSDEYKNKLQLTLLVRKSTVDNTNSDKSKQIKQYEQQGARLLYIDLQHDSIDYITQQIQTTQCSTIVSCLGDGHVVDKSQHKLIDSAIKSKQINWFIPSEWAWQYELIGYNSVVYDLEDIKIDTRKLLHEYSKQYNLSYTIICSGLFTEFYIDSFAGIDKDNKTITAPGSVNTRLSLTTLYDNAYYTCHLLTNGLSDNVQNKVVYYGTDTVSYNDTYKLLQDISNEQWNISTESLDELKQQEKQLRQQDKISAAQVIGFQILMAQQVGVYWNDNEIYNKQHKLHGTTLKQYIQNMYNKK